MLEVILDTETTGLSTTENHRIVEIGCIELNNQIVTNNVFHEYINPQRPVSKEAFDVHGYSDKFLSDKKNFSEVVDNFLNFIKNKKIIMHNANFDLSFINYEFFIFIFFNKIFHFYSYFWMNYFTYFFKIFLII